MIVSIQESKVTLINLVAICIGEAFDSFNHKFILASLKNLHLIKIMSSGLRYYQIIKNYGLKWWEYNLIYSLQRGACQRNLISAYAFILCL